MQRDRNWYRMRKLFFLYRDRPKILNVFAYIFLRKQEPEGVHGWPEDINRNLQPQAAVANNNNLAPKLSVSQVYYTSPVGNF